MSDHLLNNVRDLLGESPEFHVHSVSDARATEIVAHLDEGWSWRAEGSSEYSQWLSGRHLETGTKITIFLAAERRDESQTARGKRVLAAANLTSDQ